MKMIEDGGSAFPFQYRPEALVIQSPGMTRRQWLAGLAMKGMQANPDAREHSWMHIAEWAYKQADCMLEFERRELEAANGND